MRAGEIAALLANRAEEVCGLLLPSGKRDGAEWRCGDVSGSAGKSLGVRLTGGKAGVWRDFSTDDGGDLVGLWMAVRGVGLREAMEQASDWLGVKRPEFFGVKPRKVVNLDRPACHMPRSIVREWLRNERGLSEAAIKAYRVAERLDEVVFPYLHGENLMAVKFRNIHDKKKMRMQEGGVSCLFGWQAIPENAREVVLCEGELDALAWFDLGAPALSVPNGAQGHNWIENEFDNLEQFDTLYIAFDMDTEGQKGAAAVVDRLGRERCRLIEIPEKDANDLLRRGCMDGRPYLHSAKNIDPDELRKASDYRDEIKREFQSRRGNEIYTPWAKVEDRLVFREGEVIILAGVNGHGKSEGAGHLTLGALRQGFRCCVASMEFKPAKWLKRLVRQAACEEVPTEAHIDAVSDWWADDLYVFTEVGTTRRERILEVFSYAARRYGVRWFVIDNLAKCGIGEEDYSAQKDFVDLLTDFAKQHDAMVLLVHHIRKGQNDDHHGGKMDVKGSGAISDMADTVLIWWRNRVKQKKLEDAALDQSIEIDEIRKQPDAIVICEKQRNGEHEPKIKLWFDRKSHQFTEYYGRFPEPYVTNPGRARTLAQDTDRGRQGDAAGDQRCGSGIGAAGDYLA